jgi:hypothetical protein
MFADGIGGKSIRGFLDPARRIPDLIQQLVKRAVHCHQLILQGFQVMHDRS